MQTSAQQSMQVNARLCHEPARAITATADTSQQATQHKPEPALCVSGFAADQCASCPAFWLLEMLRLLPALCCVACRADYVLDAAWPQALHQFNMTQITAAAVIHNGPTTEIHVAQRGPSAPPVVVFDATHGAVIRTWGNGSIGSIHGMQSHNMSVFVTDIAEGTVKEFTFEGELLREVGTPNVHGNGVNPPQFDTPADVAITAGNLIAVSDGDGGSNNRVLVLNGANWETVEFGFGGTGAAPGQFSSPHSIAFDAGANALLVADRGNARIQAFDADDGGWLGQWSAGPCFTVPWAIRLSPERGVMFVADGTDGCLYVIAYNSSSLRAGGPEFACSLRQNITVGPNHTPHELAYDPLADAVYLAGVGAQPIIQRYVGAAAAATARGK